MAKVLLGCVGKVDRDTLVDDGGDDGSCSSSSLPA